MSLRRVFVPRIALGTITLPPEGAHHLTSVLRLTHGDTVEAFDSAGRVGTGTLQTDAGHPSILVSTVAEPPATPSLVVASAVPKGDRADYLVEKLGELGVHAWQPLRTTRSVVEPKGDSKIQRWNRIAQEAARQSHAPRVLEVRPLLFLRDLAPDLLSGAFFASLAEGTRDVASNLPPPSSILIGPEGGWTEEEELWLASKGAVPISLGPTVLRVETAATILAWAARQLSTPTA
jgi:16S rRNA (uracil1498-N3)-methyltransferase